MCISRTWRNIPAEWWLTVILEEKIWVLIDVNQHSSPEKITAYLFQGRAQHSKSFYKSASCICTSEVTVSGFCKCNCQSLLSFSHRICFQHLCTGSNGRQCPSCFFDPAAGVTVLEDSEIRKNTSLEKQ